MSLPGENNKIVDQIHQEHVIIDAHCDTLERAYREGENIGLFPKAQLDLVRLKTTGVKVQFFAAYIASEYKPERSLKRALQLIDFFLMQLEKHKTSVCLVKKSADIDTAIKTGQVAAVLSIEGGEPVEGDLAFLRVLYQLGVRSVGLTWNQRNMLADGMAESQTGGGLTTYGQEVVREMNRLGMLIDVSHLSERSFWDVIKKTQQPVIASHSNCYSLVSHPRNLKDNQIKALAQIGGVVGITFVPDFLNQNEANITDILNHIEFLCNLVGTDYVGIGSDFDGIDTPLKGLEEVSLLPRLTEGLLVRGYSEKDIQKILGGNFLRVLNQVIG